MLRPIIYRLTRIIMSNLKGEIFGAASTFLKLFFLNADLFDRTLLKIACYSGHLHIVN